MSIYPTAAAIVSVFADNDHALFDLGDDGFGLMPLYGDGNTPQVELYVDHKFDGSGCNNLVLAAFDREVDLEFTSSRFATMDERDAVAQMLASLAMAEDVFVPEMAA